MEFIRHIRPILKKERLVKIDNKEYIIKTFTKSYTFYGFVKNDKLYCGYAICNPKDTFVKKIGVSIAKQYANDVATQDVTDLSTLMLTSTREVFNIYCEHRLKTLFENE